MSILTSCLREPHITCLTKFKLSLMYCHAIKLISVNSFEYLFKLELLIKLHIMHCYVFVTNFTFISF